MYKREKEKQNQTKKPQINTSLHTQKNGLKTKRSMAHEGICRKTKRIITHHKNQCLPQVFEKDQRRMEEVMDLKSHWHTTPELTFGTSSVAPRNPCVPVWTCTMDTGKTFPTGQVPAPSLTSLVHYSRNSSKTVAREKDKN